MLHLPVWAIATALYLAALAFSFWGRPFRQSGDYGFAGPMMGCGAALAASVAYCLFWIVTLAL